MGPGPVAMATVFPVVKSEITTRTVPADCGPPTTNPTAALPATGLIASPLMASKKFDLVGSEADLGLPVNCSPGPMGEIFHPSAAPARITDSALVQSTSTVLGSASSKTSP